MNIHFFFLNGYKNIKFMSLQNPFTSVTFWHNHITWSLSSLGLTSMTFRARNSFLMNVSSCSRKRGLGISWGLPVCSSLTSTSPLLLVSMAEVVGTSWPLAWDGHISSSPAFVSMYGCNIICLSLHVWFNILVHFRSLIELFLVPASAPRLV